MSYAIFSVALLLFVFVLNNSRADAAINSQINFQGKLTNTNGTNVTNGTYSIEFNIYTVSSGGAAVWTETQGSVSVTDGIFRVSLGSVTSLPGSVNFNSNSLYLGIKVGADPEMTPRVQFTAAPYAFNSDTLDGIDSVGFAQLGLSTAQNESSTNSLIFLNKTSTGNLLQLQQGAVDRFVVSNAGILTSASVNSASIVDGTVANGDLVNSGVTVVAGSGLTTGGAVALGSSVTLDIGAGNGITVNANDIAVRVLTSSDGLSATTSSGSGIEVLTSGVGLLQGCSDGQILKWNETSDVWACNADSTSPGADSLNFTELSDTLSLDATTTISLGANNLTTNLSGTGDYAIQFAGNTVFQILDTGAVTIGSILSDQTIGVDNGTGAINIATDSDANTVSIGTGTAADTVTIGDANANVAITDAQWSVSGAGAASFASMTGSGLTDCDQSDDVLKWDSTTGQFSCGTNRGTSHTRLSGIYTNTTTGFTDVDDNATGLSDIGFAVGASETWVFEAVLYADAPTTADHKLQVTAPAGSTCVLGFENTEDTVSVGNIACGTTSGTLNAVTANNDVLKVNGTIVTGATAGTAMVQYGQATASGTSTIRTGSFITAFRISGADYAELYYSRSGGLPGTIMSLDGTGVSQVQTAFDPYSDKLVGVVSTKPGHVIGEADGVGTPLPIALSGRVPIKLSTENGVPKAGDMITVSGSKPGFGMIADRSGYIVGQMMMDAIDNGDGTADGYIYVRHGFWQAPLDASKITESGIHILQNEAQNDTQAVTATVSGDIQLLQELTSQNAEDVTRSDLHRIVTGLTDVQKHLNSIESVALQMNNFILFNSSLQEILTVDNDALTVVGNINFEGTAQFKSDVLFSKNMAGELMIASGQLKTEVLFEPKLSRIPTLNISPMDFIDGSWRIADVHDDKFTVELEKSQKKDVHFMWQTMQISDK